MVMAGRDRPVTMWRAPADTARSFYIRIPQFLGHWAARGACLSADPEWFVTEDELNEKRAKEVCWTCPVRTACLRDAMAVEGSHHTANRATVRGGLTPAERYSLYTAIERRDLARRREEESRAVC